MRERDTYRSERRNAWRPLGKYRPWLKSNAEYGTAFDIGGRSHDRHGVEIIRRLVSALPSSKYMPHQGKREVARRARQASDIRNLMTRSTHAEWRARHAA